MMGAWDAIDDVLFAFSRRLWDVGVFMHPFFSRSFLDFAMRNNPGICFAFVSGFVLVACSSVTCVYVAFTGEVTILASVFPFCRL